MAGAKPDPPTADERRLPHAQLVAFLTEMLLIRRVEEKVEERFRAGELAGVLHVWIGPVAVAVGVGHGAGGRAGMAAPGAMPRIWRMPATAASR